MAQASTDLFIKLLDSDDPAEADARREAIMTLLDVCSTVSLVAMAEALTHPRVGDRRPASDVALEAYRRAAN